MENKEFNKPTMEIVDINENDVIATSVQVNGICDNYDNADAEIWGN